MKRLQNSLLLALVIAVPAAAQAFLSPKQACFTAGSSAYQISASARWPDYKVRIDQQAAHPDLRIQLVDQPEIADFVLVDDFDATQTNACRTSVPIKTIRIDEDEKFPDLTISLSADAPAPDYKLYVHSARFSHQDAAALFGVMQQAARKRDLAQQR
jgi:hypothetical protein